MITRKGDLKLIHHQGKPVSYARVEEILADVKPGWWQLRLMVLQVPSKEVVWILRDEYIDGHEFTMSGETMRLEAVAPPEETQPMEPDDSQEDSDAASPDESGGSSKVVSLASKRKKK